MRSRDRRRATRPLHRGEGILIGEIGDTDISSAARRLGWELKAEGLCREDVCVLLRDRSGVRALADALRRPFVEERKHGLWAIGPESGRALTSAQLPDLTLPEWRGGDFSLGSLLGQKVLIVAWAPW
jgi:hypothetical protein